MDLPPRGQAALGAALGVVAVAELAARLAAGSTVRAGLPAAQAVHSGASVPTGLLKDCPTRRSPGAWWSPKRR